MLPLCSIAVMQHFMQLETFNHLCLFHSINVLRIFYKSKISSLEMDFVIKRSLLYKIHVVLMIQTSAYVIIILSRDAHTFVDLKQQT